MNGSHYIDGKGPWVPVGHNAVLRNVDGAWREYKITDDAGNGNRVIDHLIRDAILVGNRHHGTVVEMMAWAGLVDMQQVTAWERAKALSDALTALGAAAGDGFEWGSDTTVDIDSDDTYRVIAAERAAWAPMQRAVDDVALRLEPHSDWADKARERKGADA